MGDFEKIFYINIFTFFILCITSIGFIVKSSTQNTCFLDYIENDCKFTLERTCETILDICNKTEIYYKCLLCENQYYKNSDIADIFYIFVGVVSLVLVLISAKYLENTKLKYEINQLIDNKN